MSNNDCQICQYHANLKQGEMLLREAITKSVFALLVKTQESQTDAAEAKKNFIHFTEEHPEIKIKLSVEESKYEIS